MQYKEITPTLRKELNENLYSLSKLGIKDAVKALIISGADDFELGCRGAIDGNQINVVHLLINQEFKLRKAFYYAVRKGNIEIAKVILSNLHYYEIYDDEEDDEGYIEIEHYYDRLNLKSLNKALRIAAKEGHNDIVNYLITQGACDWDGALQAAKEGEHLSLVSKFETKINEINRLGKEKLDEINRLKQLNEKLFSVGDDIVLAQSLIDQGARPSAGLMGAVEGGHLETAKFFIAKGAHCNNDNIICIAAEKGYKEMVYFFVRKEMDEEATMTNMGPYTTLINFFIQKDAKSNYLKAAIKGGQKDLEQYFRNLGIEEKQGFTWLAPPVNPETSVQVI